MSGFKQITIIGVGLLGGSLAKACRERKLVERIVGFGRMEKRVQRAIDHGVVDEGTTDMKTAVENADLVVLCSPVGTLAARLREMAPHLKKGCVVTDVGSVKGPVVTQLDAVIPDGTFYVGSHPIAGGEKSGFDASSADLYEGAQCIVTPTDKTDADALKRIIQFWEQVGMQVETLDADEHDTIYAAVSHLPHVVAYALMNTVGSVSTPSHDEVLSLSAGGLRDITRIASSDPVMWRDICLANREPLLDLIGRFEATLEEIRTQIERGDGEALKTTFENANGHRNTLAGMDA